MSMGAMSPCIPRRKTLERFKWVLFVTVPVWFGYGFARDPANLEWVKREVRALQGPLIVSNILGTFII